MLVPIFVEFQEFSWNFKNFRGIEEYLHGIATTWTWIVNFLKKKFSSSLSYPVPDKEAYY